MSRYQSRHTGVQIDDGIDKAETAVQSIYNGSGHLIGTTKTASQVDNGVGLGLTSAQPASTYDGLVVGISANNAVLPIVPPDNSNTIVLFGDSITANNNVTNGQPAPNNTMIQWKLSDIGYFTWANIKLKNAFKVIRNSAISGQRTDQLLARVQTDVINYHPDWCLLMAGTNDVNGGISASTIVSNLRSIYQALVASGIKVIACSMIPNNTFNSGSTAVKDTFSYVNNWIRQYAKSNNMIYYVDTFSSIYDGSTACGAVAGTLSDSAHPGAYGASVIGSYFASSVSSLVSSYPPVQSASADLASASNPYGNIYQYSVQNGTSGVISGNTVFTGTPSNGWWLQGVSDSVNCAATLTKVARTDCIGLTMWRSVVTWTSAQSGVATFNHRMQTNSPIPAGIVPGDILDAEIELDYKNVTNAGAMEINFTARDAGGATLDAASFVYSQSTTTPTPAFNGIVAIRGFVVPANTAFFNFYLTCRNLAGTNGGYTLDIGNISLRKRLPNT